ncbi:phosphoesterase [Hesseltinella vesiculosa]|uniref:Phosphoesterase n=1 Tax=Hesseltinella vesiculosa TaxID=101127 RepID=A0A1X2G4X6_9FUNG|nr:phosphoesterase [Hesseltinella vesiculosa]
MVLIGKLSLLCIAAATALAAPTSADWKSKIKNVVVLVQENRSFDTFAGGFTYNKEINGLAHHKYCNPSNITDTKSQQVCANQLDAAHNVAGDDPNHSMSGVNVQLFGTADPSESAIKSGKLAASMQGFVTEQESSYKTNNLTRASEVINYYTEKHIPVFASMARNFVLFDRWFCDVSGPTNPNRAYVTSGTSYGHGRNDNLFNYGGLPQKSIFQQLSEKNITWINYSNSTNSDTGYIVPPAPAGVTGFNPDALFYKWTVESGAAKTNVKPFKQFLVDAAAGTLPAFSYINPECCSYDSFHPPSPIETGEQFIKTVYESVRNSPQWNETLFILTFDEHGGFGDHVPPPVNVPAGDNLTYTEKGHTFDFTRLGVRIPVVLMSPWLPKNHVEHKGTNNGGEYSNASILGFLAKLWDLENLTPRTAWSSTFEHLFTKKFRSNTPSSLPDITDFP